MHVVLVVSYHAHVILVASYHVHVILVASYPRDWDQTISGGRVLISV